MALRKLLLIPQLTYYLVRAPRDQKKAWDRFWGKVTRTGPSGHVLWDAGSDDELATLTTCVLDRMDKSLPVVDIGCGNGRFSRFFARHFPRVLGVDVSANAIARA